MPACNQQTGILNFPIGLAVSATAMAAATPVESATAAAVEAAAYPGPGSDVAAGVSATNIAATESVSWMSTTPSAAVSIPVAAAPVPAAIAPTAAPTPVIPGTCADEDAACEPLRTVVTIRGASIRIVSVITPIANRGSISDRRGNHRRPNSHANRNLGICCHGEGDHQESS